MPVVGIGSFWDLSYFTSGGVYTIDDIDFEGTPIIQTQVTGDIASALNATSGDVPGTGYAAKFTTTVTLDEAEEIALYLAAAGDATIYVDGMEVASVRCETLEGAAQGPCPNSGGSMCLCNAGSRYKADAEILTIDAGVHDITVEYLSHAKGDIASLDWAVGNEGRRPFDLEIPYASANVVENAMSYEFYDGTPEGLTIENMPTEDALATGVISDLDVEALARDVTNSDETFSIRYTGQIRITEGGSYSFNLGSDDGAKLLINGAALLTNDGVHDLSYVNGTLDLEAGVHDIELIYFENTGLAALDLEITGPDTGGVSSNLLDGDIEVFTTPYADDFDADGGGVWQGVEDWPLIGIHAIITPDFQVLTFGTDGSGIQTGQVIYDVWDYETKTHYTLPNTTGTDIFCSVPFFDPISGRVIIAGGDARPLGAVNKGVEDANVYDPADRSLKELETGDMNYTRWYETAVTLANGKTMLIGGIDTDGNPVGRPEVYTPGVGFKTLDGLSDADVEALGISWFYTRAFPTSSGKVAVISDTWSGTMHMIDPSGDGSMSYYGQVDFFTSASVPALMYREDKILVMDNEGGLFSLDVSGDAPVTTKVAQLDQARIFSNMLITPNGEVLIVGGTDEGATTAYGNPDKSAVTWNPDTGEVTTHDSEALARLYHSTAILLPDGTVMSLGGGAPGPLNNTNAENFRPDYLYEEDGTPAERLVIVDAPSKIEQGDQMRIKVDDPEAVARVTMVKNGSVTHTVNMETRFEELSFEVDEEGYLVATTNTNSNVFTPGGWMLFVLDEDGVPSHAASVEVGLGGEHYDEGLGSYFTLNGPAEVDETGAFVFDPELRESGAAHSNARVDFEFDFTLSMRILIETKGSGMTLLFHNNPYDVDATGASGAKLGADGIDNGVGIEFDIYKSDENDISDQHSGIFSLEGGGRTIIGTDTPLTTLRDQDWHDVVVTWDAATQTLSYSYDGVELGSYTGNLALDHFGDTSAHFAITASNGTYRAEITDFDGYLETDERGVEARPDRFEVAEDGQITGNLMVDNGTGADRDARGLDLSMVHIEGDTDGQVTLSSGAQIDFAPDGSFTYDPAGSFDYLPEGALAEDKFIYKIENADGDQDAQLVRITITGVEQIVTPPPSAFDDAYSVSWSAEKQVVVFSPNGVLSNDGYIDPDALVVSAVGNALPGEWIDATGGGQIRIYTDGAISFRDPDGDFAELARGETALIQTTYVVDSGENGSDEATVTLTVNGTKDTAPSVMGDVRGFVFRDTNGNNVYDNQDNRESFVPVRLFSADGTEVAITATSSTGNFRFREIEGGDYFIEVAGSDGLTFVTPDQGAIEGRDSDITDITTGRSDIFTIDSEAPLRLQAGRTVASTEESAGTVLGTVFHDVNGNDFYDGADTPMEDITTILRYESGVEFGRFETLNTGRFRFEDVPLGNYVLEFDKPDDMVFVAPGVGGLEERDSDITDFARGVTDVFAVNTTDVYRFQAGIADNPDFVYLGTVRGFVFDDNDGNDAFGAGDRRMADVVVRLLDEELAEVAQFTTNLSGSFVFRDVVAGTYTLAFDPVPGADFVDPNQGAIEGRDSDVTDLALGHTDPFALDWNQIVRLQAGFEDVIG